MLSCTFFGHRDCPDSLRAALVDTLTHLILTEGVTMFYVGNQGQFDALVRSVLRELSPRYPQIRYAVVLAYLPRGSAGSDADPTMLPEGIEFVHPRNAISWRNRWMLTRADFVVTYITHTWGGAAKYADLARREGKTLLPLGTC